MSKETQPLPYEEIKKGSPENYISYGQLTPDAFRQIKGQLGKPINVTFVNESWIYQGPDEEDHSISETHVSGTLIKVDEGTIEVEINSEVEIISGETTYDSGAVIKPRGTHKEHKEFPFYQEQFILRKYAEILRISIFTVEDQTFQLR